MTHVHVVVGRSTRSVVGGKELRIQLHGDISLVVIIKDMDNCIHLDFDF